MKKGEVIKQIAIEVLAALVLNALLYGIGYMVSLFNREKLNITICTSTMIENEYCTCINLKNYQDDKSINSLIIWSDANIDVSRLNYKDVEKNNDKVIIKNIPPSYDGTMLIYSQEKINKENTKFETEEKRVVNFLYNQEEVLTSYWKQVASNMIIYIIIYSIMILIIHSFTKKEIDIYKKEMDFTEETNKRLEKEYENIKRETEFSKKEIQDIRDTSLRIKIHLHRKLEDYAKELNFYRNIIKNVVNKDGKKEDVCYQITKELNTFRTHEKVKIEDLELKTLELSDFEREKIIKHLNDNKKG